MATIRKKGEHQWHVQVRKKGHPSQTRTFTTRADALRWGKETEIAIERGQFFDRSIAERTTLREVIARYRADILPMKKGKHYPSALRQLDSALGPYSLASITSEMVARHRDARLQKVSPSTIKKEINLLSMLIDLAAKEWGIPLAINPCDMVKRPSEPKGRDRRLQEGEEELLLAECSKSSLELEILVRVALATSARLGELLKLRWEHIDEKKRTAKLLDTKNGEDRDIPLSTAAFDALNSLRSRDPSGRVFQKWIAADSFNKTWARTCARAGIKDLRFHDLRHEAISRLFEKSLNPMEVSSISGHKSLAMLKRYTHLRAEDLVKKLG